MAAPNYAKALKPRLDRLGKAGVSLNELFRRAKVSRSNWSRWTSGDTSPTLKTHLRFMAIVEDAEKEVARKTKRASARPKPHFDPAEI